MRNLNMKMKILTGLLLTVCLATISSAVSAQDLLIRNATVHTVTPSGTLQSTDILIREGRIDEIGSQLEAPEGVDTLDAEGRPVTPGFFAGVTALGLVEIGAVEHTADASLSLKELRPEFKVMPAYNPNSSLIPITRIEGFTWSVLGPGRAGSIIAGQGQPVSLDGGYDSFMSEPVLFVDIGGDASSLTGGSRAAQWMIMDQAMGDWQSGEDLDDLEVLTPAGRMAISQFFARTESGQAKRAIIFDVDRASDILQVLRFANLYSLNAIISGGAEAWAVADELAESGTPVIVNALANLPSSFDALGSRLDNAALLHAAGVTIAFEGAGTHQARKLRQIAGNAVANGLPWDAALAAMTINPAMMFGLEENAGSLSEGANADIVIWSGDPLEVTTKADQVIMGGEAIPMVSRQTLLRDRYLPEQPEGPRAYIKP